MRYTSNPALLASLAEAYVVGTLTRRARRRFERLCEVDAAARSALHAAEDRLVGLSMSLEPVQPSAATWAGIVAQTGAGARTTPRRKLVPASPAWRMAIAAGLAMLALGLSWLVLQQRLAPPTALATVTTETGAQLWALEVFGDRDRLSARVTGAVELQPGRSYELWALPEGGAPVSLGLLPEAGEVDRPLTEVQRIAMRSSPKVAVSLEPAGGSPTGAPTGPVLYVADLKVQPT